MAKIGNNREMERKEKKETNLVSGSGRTNVTTTTPERASSSNSSQAVSTRCCSSQALILVRSIEGTFVPLPSSGH